jgi:hypothetical protein
LREPFPVECGAGDRVLEAVVEAMDKDQQVPPWRGQIVDNCYCGPKDYTRVVGTSEIWRMLRSTKAGGLKLGTSGQRALPAIKILIWSFCTAPNLPNLADPNFRISSHVIG